MRRLFESCIRHTRAPRLAEALPLAAQALSLWDLRIETLLDRIETRP